MSRVTPRAARLAAWIAIPAALVASGAVVSTASYSAFSATTVNPTSNWTAGSVALSDDDNNTALFTATGLKPGSTGANCITVTSTGSLASTVKLYATNAQTSSALASNTALVIEQGTGGGFGSCSGFTPAATNGTLTPANTTLASFATGEHELRQRPRHLGADRHRLRVPRLPDHLHGVRHRAELGPGHHRLARPDLGGPEQLSRVPRPSPRPCASSGPSPSPRPHVKAVMVTIAVHGGPAPRDAVRGAVEWGRVVVATLARGVVVTLLGLALWAAAPAVIGWHPTTVMTGSMEPRLRPGDVVVSRPVPPAELRLGQVLLADDPDQPGHLRMHRAVTAGPDGTIVTKGDANPQRDSTPIARSAVHGVAVLRIPAVATPIVWMRDGEWTKVALLALVFAATLWLCTVDGSLRRATSSSDSSGSLRFLRFLRGRR